MSVRRESLDQPIAAERVNRRVKPWRTGDQLLLIWPNGEGVELVTFIEQVSHGKHARAVVSREPTACHLFDNLTPQVPFDWLVLVED